MSATHKCPVKGCEIAVPRSMLMCYQHWRMVPGKLQGELWRAYRQGAGTPVHHAAVKVAIEVVNNALARSSK